MVAIAVIATVAFFSFDANAADSRKLVIDDKFRLGMSAFDVESTLYANGYDQPEELESGLHEAKKYRSNEWIRYRFEGDVVIELVYRSEAQGLPPAQLAALAQVRLGKPDEERNDPETGVTLLYRGDETEREIRIGPSLSLIHI